MKYQATKRFCNNNTYETGEAPSPVEPLMDAFMADEIKAILSNHFQQAIEVESAVLLSDPDRRNRIIRIVLKGSGTKIPKTIILKQTVFKASIEDEAEFLKRFARDWAGLEFLCQRGATIVPQFYGGSIAHRFILLEDLGDNHVSLVDSLTCDDVQAAEAALSRFMKSVGQFHGASYGHTDDYYKILHQLNPAKESWQNNLKKTIVQSLTKLEELFKLLNIPVSTTVWQEVEWVFEANFTPGPFTVLTHGDICPDNVFDNASANKLHIIDFEHANVRNALLDGTYLRMSMPTCWCAKAFPEHIIQKYEDTYRTEICKKISAANDDVAYTKAYGDACAFWMIKSLLSIEKLLEKDEKCGSGPVPDNSLWRADKNLMRPRILSRLQAFIKVSQTHNIYLPLCELAEKVLAILKVRWPDAQPLSLYPVFDIDKLNDDEINMSKSEHKLYASL